MSYTVTPIVYEFVHALGRFDIIFDDEYQMWYACDLNGYCLNLKYLKLDYKISSHDFYSLSIEDICTQICVYLNREALNNSIIG